MIVAGGRPFRGMTSTTSGVPRVSAIHARHGYWTASDAPLESAQHDKLKALLDNGERYTGATDGGSGVCH